MSKKRDFSNCRDPEFAKALSEWLEYKKEVAQNNMRILNGSKKLEKKKK